MALLGGLDKANEWSGENTFSNTLSIAGNTLFTRDRPQVTIGTIPSSSIFYGVTRFRDSNNNSFALERGTISSTWNYRKWFVYNFSDVSMYSAFELGIKHDGSEKYFLIDSDKLIPNTTGVSDLGTSTNKWKSLNGVNPGALSLPNLNYSDTNKWIDLSGNITDETGGSNKYDPTVDGWVVIRANNNPTSLRVNVHAPRPSTRKYVSSATGVDIDGTMIVSVPAPAGSRVYIYFNKGSGSLDSATFITCQGNV